MKPRRDQRGVVAIEMAFIVLFIVLMLPPVLFFGQMYWRYNVLQQAASNAARYLAAAPPVEMTDVTGYTAALATARTIANGAGTAVGLPLNISSLILSCDSCSDNTAPPTLLGVKLKVKVVDDVFYDISSAWLVSPAVYISGDLQVPYAN